MVYIFNPFLYLHVNGITNGVSFNSSDSAVRQKVSSLLKRHVALDRSRWSTKAFVTVCYEMHMVKDLTLNKWPTALVNEVKRKPRNFEACLCRSLYSTFTTSFYP